ncbi:MAG: hypothetical protein ACI8RD_005830 [Bacillariaceae sp.]|jgi:hypothetical protein
MATSHKIKETYQKSKHRKEKGAIHKLENDTESIRINQRLSRYYRFFLFAQSETYY